ncbi:Single-stranded-DNA-specific exonuclease RecJ [hydrothermal vent metagenome]|uniref:Single-stranded-DNA-specific exonuclease RecJ n=1 Tax=hydrothermal vent metagenome TaxID=652676 RepID=A0A3B1A059_9ZZZZ
MIIKHRVNISEIQFDSDFSLLDRIYQQRNITDVTQLDTSLAKLHDYKLLTGIDAAVSLLLDSLKVQRKICIVGDFDADGATSCALSLRGLTALGFKNVSYQVPNRFDFGYGLTPEIVNYIASDAANKPDLIITVDNGISSISGVAVAKQLGIDVIVTDHHLPGAELPKADAIINPNQAFDEFPSKMLAGVGVMFYLLMALRAALRDLDWFNLNNQTEPQLAKWLDIVALGTIADVVPLDHNNRILVAQGLARIRAGKCSPGILALLKVAGKDYQRCVASDIGFTVGPRLNAAGRLDDITIGIECLLTDDDAIAMQYAQQLDQLNRERKTIESEMRESAEQHLSALNFSDSNSAELPLGLCLYQADWHQGVIGILASRIKEQTHRPVIAFAKSTENEIKGSARSIPGLHIRDVLESVSAAHPNLIIKFGGHAMAAGLSLRESDFELFNTAFSYELSKSLDKNLLQNVIYSDGELEEKYLTLKTAENLRYALPWGQGFPEPVFDGEFEVVQSRVVGKKHLKLVLRGAESDTEYDAIAFNQSDNNDLYENDVISIAYRLDVNEYLGRESLQLMVEHIFQE